MINLAVINIKEVVKYLVKLTIVITVVVALTRYFSTYKNALTNKFSDKTFLECINQTIPGIKVMNKAETKTPNRTIKNDAKYGISDDRYNTRRENYK